MKTSALRLTVLCFVLLKYKLTAVKNKLCSCSLTKFQQDFCFDMFRLPVKPRQPCSTGRCLRSCVASLIWPVTPLRPLLSALSKLPSSAVPALSLCSPRLAGENSRCPCLVNLLCKAMSHNILHYEQRNWFILISLYPSTSAASFTDAHGSCGVCQLSLHSQSVLHLWPFEIWTLTFYKLILTPCLFLAVWEFILITHDTEDVPLSAGWIS